MPFEISKKEGLDINYYGYHTEYTIDFQFKKQSANVSIEIWDDEPNEVRLKSNTDGYHWLQYFLCQEPNTEKLLELSYDDEIARCKKAFAAIDIFYEQEGKDTAWLTINSIVDENLINQIASVIEPRFANRERFFE